MGKKHDLLVVETIKWLKQNYPKATYQVEHLLSEGFVDILLTHIKTDKKQEIKVLEVKTNPEKGVTEAIRQLKRYASSFQIKTRDELFKKKNEYKNKSYELWLVTNYNINALKLLLEIEGIGWLVVFQS